MERDKMQVINVTNKVMKYHTKGTVIVFNPGVITYVSEDLTTAKKLQDCYGSRIRFIDEEAIEKAYAAYSGNAKPAEPTTEEVPEEPTEEPEPTVETEPTEDPEPIEEPTVEPEPTPEPTEEPEPTVEPEPTTEEVPEEPTVEPEHTPEPTEEPEPTVEVETEIEEPKVAKKSTKGKGSKKNK